MNSTWPALAQACAGIAAFALFFLPPGFLVAHGLNLNGFRQRSRVEQLLWSLCLSVPLSIQICTGLGRVLPTPAITAIQLTLAALALAVFLRRSRPAYSQVVSRPTLIALALAGALGLYLVLAATDIQIGHRLFISTAAYDWSVRVPMVAAAIRSGVPPVNGLSALDGHPASLRYFYFWYVVCANLARLFHLPARASLAASCVWAAWALLAVFFLALKCLLGIHHHLRQKALFAFPVLAIMGLDVIPTVRYFLVKRLHPFPEIEWWHQDRTPSFLSASLYAPHHIAAFACLLTGLLLLTRTLRNQPGEPRPRSPRDLASAALLAGTCFASAAGTSILPTLIVAIVCLVWAAELLRQRQFPTLAALAGSAVTALLLARTFLHEVQTNTAAASGGSLLTLHWRNYDLIHSYQQKYYLSHRLWIDQPILQIGVLIINLIDLGFFFFVLVHRIRRDRHRTLTPAERSLWAFLAGVAIPYFFLSSASFSSPNDLGVDAGLLLRLLLQIFAVPWVYDLWQDRKSAQPTRPNTRVARTAMTLATGCLVLGLATEAIQVLWERLYFPITASQILRKPTEVFTTDHLGERLYNIREAYTALDRTPNPPPPTDAIQYNPIGVMQPALTLYSTHQIAAFDRGCGTGYGGDYTRCRSIMPTLLALYGNTETNIDGIHFGNDLQDGAAPTIATATDALAACRDLHLSALIVESTDTIWSKPTSWVWTMHPVAANPSVRVFRCH